MASSRMHSVSQHLFGLSVNEERRGLFAIHGSLSFSAFAVPCVAVDERQSSKLNAADIVCREALSYQELHDVQEPKYGVAPNTDRL